MTDSTRPLIASFNVGSSSLKFSLHQARKEMTEFGSGMIFLDGDVGHLSFTCPGYPPIKMTTSHNRLCVSVAGLAKLVGGHLSAVGHRLVHGGVSLRKHLKINREILKTINDAICFAPLHLPPAIRLIEQCFTDLPDVPQVGCLDTAFHDDLPAAAKILPLPLEIRELGVQRFGFHGLSCESIVAQLEKDLPNRLIVAHLGGGSSITAIRNGRSIDTSMALTPMGGAVMSQRPGDLDPGIVFYLLRDNRYRPQALESLLEHQSGLAGISQTDGDLRNVQAASDQGNTFSTLALDIYVRSISKQIAGAMVVLGGVDLLVFTGGVGEHAEDMRQRILELLIPINRELKSRTLPSLENERIAYHTARLLDLC